MRRRDLLYLVSGPLWAAPAPEYNSAVRKLASLETDRVPAGTSVSFSHAEINAYARQEAPPGVRKPEVRLLGQERAAASALVDFSKFGEARGLSGNWLLRNLLAGERPVAATVRIQSRGGQCRVDVERVEVSGVPLEGSALAFLIDNFVRPLYPDARIGQWFPLRHKVESIRISPSAILVRVFG